MNHCITSTPYSLNILGQQKHTCRSQDWGFNDEEAKEEENKETEQGEEEEPEPRTIAFPDTLNIEKLAKMSCNILGKDKDKIDKEMYNTLIKRAFALIEGITLVDAPKKGKLLLQGTTPTLILQVDINTEKNSISVIQKERLEYNHMMALTRLNNRGSKLTNQNLNFRVLFPKNKSLIQSPIPLILPLATNIAPTVTNTVEFISDEDMNLVMDNLINDSSPSSSEEEITLSVELKGKKLNLANLLSEAGKRILKTYAKEELDNITNTNSTGNNKRKASQGGRVSEMTTHANAKCGRGAKGNRK